MPLIHRHQRRMKRRFSGHWRRLPKEEVAKREREAAWLEEQIPKSRLRRWYEALCANVSAWTSPPTVGFVLREVRGELLGEQGQLLRGVVNCCGRTFRRLHLMSLMILIRNWIFLLLYW